MVDLRDPLKRARLIHDDSTLFARDMCMALYSEYFEARVEYLEGNMYAFYSEMIDVAVVAWRIARGEFYEVVAMTAYGDWPDSEPAYYRSDAACEEHVRKLMDQYRSYEPEKWKTYTLASIPAFLQTLGVSLYSHVLDHYLIAEKAAIIAAYALLCVEQVETEVLEADDDA